MAALTDYTTYAEIRAILGVAEEEIEDATLALPIYFTEMLEDMYELAPNMSANYIATKALPSPTADQARFLRLVSAWAGYEVANQCLTSISMFGPKTIESDKDKLERVLDPYAALRENVPAAMTVAENRLLALYAVLFPSDPLPDVPDEVVVVNVGLATDPVTG